MGRPIPTYNKPIEISKETYKALKKLVPKEPLPDGCDFILLRKVGRSGYWTYLIQFNDEGYNDKWFWGRTGHRNCLQVI